MVTLEGRPCPSALRFCQPVLTSSRSGFPGKRFTTEEFCFKWIAACRAEVEAKVEYERVFSHSVVTEKEAMGCN